MQTISFILSFFLFGISFSTQAQQATEIDPKFIKLLHYADLAAINLIPSCEVFEKKKQSIIIENINLISLLYANNLNFKL